MKARHVYYKGGFALFLNKVCQGQHIRTGTQAIFFPTDLLISLYSAIWPSKPAHSDNKKHCLIASAGVHNRVQWVHRLGEIGSGSNVTDPVASPKSLEMWLVSPSSRDRRVGGKNWSSEEWGVEEGALHRLPEHQQAGGTRFFNFYCHNCTPIPLLWVCNESWKYTTTSVMNSSCAVRLLTLYCQKSPSFCHPAFHQWGTAPGHREPYFAVPPKSSL